MQILCLFVLEIILKDYTSTGAEVGNLTRTRGYLEDAFVSGAATCLICISHIKRSDAVSIFKFLLVKYFIKYKMFYRFGTVTNAIAVFI